MPIKFGGYKVVNAYFCDGNGKLWRIKKGYFGSDCVYKYGSGPQPKPSIEWVKLSTSKTYDTTDTWLLKQGDSDVKIYVITNGVIPSLALLGGWENQGSWEMYDDTHTINGNQVYIYSAYGKYGSRTNDTTIPCQDWGWNDGGNMFAFDGDKLVLSNSLSNILKYMD